MAKRKSKPKDTPWLVITKGSPAGMGCQRCGAEHRFVVPMESGRFLKVMHAFIALHTECEEPGTDAPRP